ncbi:MAG: DUF2497 domain-containing protein [Pseudomonadota bacterium]|nr:DUF2497 domain-containing protein [Pseudomonadota bacterium]
MRLAGEPSVDEILDSIKKVIARDDRAGIEARDKTVAEAAEKPSDMPVADDDDVLDLAVAGHFLPSEDEAGVPPDSGASPETTPLVTPQSRDAMRESLAALAMMATAPASPQTVRSGETSLEEMARELLRPALAAWLDQHLPAMVERLVASEIARIVGKKS